MGMNEQASPGIARFKELCLDTHPLDGVGTTDLSAFWAAATGCKQLFFQADPDGAPTAEDRSDPGDVVGPEEGANIAICPVPEPRTVKHRVHLDVSVESVADLVALGARVLREPDDEISWTVMADPEGGEFCAFERTVEKLTPYRAFELNVDSVDAELNARWWAGVFGVEARNDGKPWWWIDGVAGFPSRDVAPWWGIIFANVPEPKTVKNRMHWDVYGDVADFVARGATVLWELPRWTTMADPEGNEFCVFPHEDVEPVETS